ncbi:MAG: hydrogenase maturation nickel metallochaperone HypA [Alphaproteobacteria bacterium]|nr:hydrogenase maturation nickel metallochaperone HypA [Alphaproteobacteria bacterium]
MHELSIIHQVGAYIISTHSEAELQQIEAFEMHLGQLSNIHPDLLQNAYLAYQETHPIFNKILLKTTLIPTEIYCNQCHQTTQVEHYKFQCKFCLTPSQNIVKGNELTIHKIIFKDLL